MTWLETAIEQMNEIVKHYNGDMRFSSREFGDNVKIIIYAGKNYTFVIPKDNKAKKIEKV